MAYTLQQIFEDLEKVENGGSMVADLQTEISKVRSEAANNRISRNKVLDALGLRDSDNVDDSIKNLATTLSVLQQLGGDPQKMGTQMETSFPHMRG